MEVVAENGDLLHNVLAHARYLCEEEEGEEAGHAAEAAEEGTAGGKSWFMEAWRVGGADVRLHEGAGGDAVVVAGDGVSGRAGLASLRGISRGTVYCRWRFRLLFAKNVLVRWMWCASTNPSSFGHASFLLFPSSHRLHTPVF